MEKYKLDLNKIRQFNFSEHHIVKGCQAETINQVSLSVLGLHSARLQTPFVTLIPRVDRFQTKHLQEQLYSNCSLIKLRCMRRTLHIVPIDFAPIVHQATVKLRISDCLTFYKNHKVSLSLVEKIKSHITGFLTNNPSSSKSICTHVLDHVDATKEMVRIVIKHLWEEGVICYLNTSDHWGSESRLYAITTEKYPKLNLNSISESEAKRELIFRHIQQFGPVTVKDIAWWSGLSMKAVKVGIDSFQSEIQQIQIKGDTKEYYITVKALERLNKLTPPKSDWITLLAYEDPSLKGYFESRSRYVSLKHYNMLYNQIGEARASVVMNGKVIGIWQWDKRKRQVVINLFYKLRKRELELLDSEKQKFEDCLNQYS